MDTSAIIERLGGTGETAKVCAVTPAAVTLWKQTGIPPRHWPKIVAHAEARSIPGITFDVVQTARHLSQGGAQ
jgi:hypothetical protein